VTSNEKTERVGTAYYQTYSSFRRVLSRFLIPFLFLAGCVGFVLGVESHRFGEAPETALVVTGDMSSCVLETRPLLSGKDLEINDLRDLLSYCFSLHRNQGLLRDFEIRRLIFSQEMYANGVMLWMVVAITISGVLLAALQLVANYKLASTRDGVFAEQGEINLARDKIVLKSSVTGLFILLISFAFFIVFVLYVYQYKEVDMDNDRPTKNTPSENLEPGGLGRAPPLPKPADQAR
jgi:hypothetical protein